MAVVAAPGAHVLVCVCLRAHACLLLLRLQKSDKDGEAELSLKEQIRKEFDETFDSVKEFGAFIGRC